MKQRVAERESRGARARVRASDVGGAALVLLRWRWNEATGGAECPSSS